uniref:Integrase catalytic domain-containing protein n=1 Tax=Arundo donax TaxID=35708 RepID=A0A0A9AFY1_ARUDO
MQEDHPIAFLSKALCPRNQGLSTYEKECLAIILAVDHWRPYLQHDEFILRIDHKSLTHLTQQRVHSPLQQRALTKLMSLQYQLQYKQGQFNKVADALSRRTPTAESELVAISICKPAWLDTVIQSYQDDPFTKKLLLQFSLPKVVSSEYSLLDGVLRYKGRIWIGINSDIQHHIITALHNSALGGHSGFYATYHQIKRLFAWTNMKATIKAFIQKCTACQQAKTERVATPGLLQPLPIPDQIWSVVSLDFIEGLPKSANHDTILVVLDKFSKYAHFIALTHPFTALQVAKVYMSNIFKLHGLPKAIISDRDRIFTSTLWQELFRLAQTHLQLSSSYHPQTDGQTEHVNQCLEAYLRCTVHSCPGNWFHWLPLAEYWYNTSYHTSLGSTPFEVLYGRKPRDLGVLPLQDSTVSDLSSWLKERNIIQNLLQQQLARAQHRQKQQADKHRSERSFEVGDSVYLKLQTYIQTPIAQRSNQKLAFRYYGPFNILAKVGAVAYKLQLPADSHIHPVVHVSQLKKAVGPDAIVSSELPPSVSVLQDIQTPACILDHKLIKRGKSTVARVLIQWKELLVDMATWEDLDEMRWRFPHSTAWGQAVLQEEGNVTDGTPREPAMGGTRFGGTMEANQAHAGKRARQGHHDGVRSVTR